MKTIKFTLFGLIALLVAVLSIKYAVVSLHYTTTDFTTIDTKDIYNFGLTFAIQAILLTAFGLFAIAVAVGAFQLAIKYYHISAKIRRDMALMKHIEEERYNELVNKLRATDSLDKKREYIDEYLDYNTNKNRKGTQIHEVLEKRLKDRLAKKVAEPVTTKEASKSDLFPKEGIDFIRVDKNIHKD